jgi:hypothetical protein
METRTLLRDFQSHNQSRSVYTVEKGLVVKAKKIRLIDFNIYTDMGYTTTADINLHPLAGVYSLIKKVSFLNLQGQEIDSMTNCTNNMALRLLHMDNGAQSEINSIVSMTRNGFSNPSESVIISDVQSQTVSTDTLDLYLDVPAMLNYLNTREHISEGFTIIIEWNNPSVWAPPSHVLDLVPLYISAPTLALDEVLGMSESQVNMQPVMFSTMVNDQIRFLPTDINKTTRLNSYYNQFISNLYYLNNWSFDDYEGLGFSKDQQETFELTIDGKKLLPLKGVDTPARKLAYLNDFTGESTVLLGSNQLLNNPLNVNLVDTEGYITELDNLMSYGCIKLDRFIQNDMTITYSRPDLGAGTNIINLVTLAEVLKMYDPKSGQLSYVRQ